MSNQHFTLLAKMAMAMPNMSVERMQFWIERPTQLKTLLAEMSTSEQLKYIYETLNDVLSLWPKTLVSGQRRRIRYTHTKKAAYNSDIRHDLPEQHVFEWRSIDLFYTAAEMLKYHFDYGHAMGLSPSTPNILYENSDTFGVSVLVIQKGKLPDDPWQLKVVFYNDTETVWPAGTRVFFLDSTE